jgi:hypothetical protein
MELHDYIDWPLPSWEKIENRRGGYF